MKKIYATIAVLVLLVICVVMDLRTFNGKGITWPGQAQIYSYSNILNFVEAIFVILFLVLAVSILINRIIKKEENVQKDKKICKNLFHYFFNFNILVFGIWISADANITINDINTVIKFIAPLVIVLPLLGIELLLFSRWNNKNKKFLYITLGIILWLFSFLCINIRPC